MLGIAEADYGRVIMVGNNLERDVAGANRLGLLSVFFHGNERRRTEPLTPGEQPNHTVANAGELLRLIAQLERGD
jgi:putative hydrolase of the HAD superfamily